MTQEEQGLLSNFLKKQRYLQASRVITPYSRILDIGCGGGSLLSYIQDLNIDYYGADILKQDRWVNENYFEWNVNKKIPDQLLNVKFDYIVALALLEHIKEPGVFLNRISALLNENGKIVITTPHPIGRSFHDLGAKFGLFSRDAAEEHEKFLDKKDLFKIIKHNNLKLEMYKRFLFSFNQLIVIKG